MRKRILALLIASTVAIVSVTVGCSKKTTTNTNIEETSPSDVTTPEEETTASTEGTTTEAEGEVSTEDVTTSEDDVTTDNEDVTFEEDDVTTDEDSSTSEGAATPTKPATTPTKPATTNPTTVAPTAKPTVAPTKPAVTNPTTVAPTTKPTVAPTKPATKPTVAPTKPTVAPTQPTTVAPTKPAAKPTVAPTKPATAPTTAAPETSKVPSNWKKVEFYDSIEDCTYKYYSNGTWIFEYTADPLNRMDLWATQKGSSKLTLTYRDRLNYDKEMGLNPVEREGLLLVKYLGNEENLEIPKVIDGCEVIGVDSGFCTFSPVIKTLTIPETLTYGFFNLNDTNITKVIVKGTKWNPRLGATNLNSDCGTVIYCEYEMFKRLYKAGRNTEAVFKSLDGKTIYWAGNVSDMMLYSELHNCDLPLEDCKCEGFDRYEYTEWAGNNSELYDSLRNGVIE